MFFISIHIKYNNHLRGLRWKNYYLYICSHFCFLYQVVLEEWKTSLESWYTTQYADRTDEQARAAREFVQQAAEGKLPANAVLPPAVKADADIEFKEEAIPQMDDYQRDEAGDIIRDAEGNNINDTVHFLGFDFNNDALISYVTAAAFLVVSVLSPFLSGIADYVGNKKNFLKFFCYLGALSCIGLFWFNMEFLWFGLLCYFLALIGFWSSLVFYNSYLPDIAFPEQQDKISAKGFSLGYIGSVISRW